MYMCKYHRKSSSPQNVLQIIAIQLNNHCTVGGNIHRLRETATGKRVCSVYISVNTVHMTQVRSMGGLWLKMNKLC